MRTTQSKWFRFAIAMMKTTMISTMAGVILSFSAIGLSKYADIRIPFSFVFGLTFAVGVGVGGHLTNKWKRTIAED